MYSLHKQGIPLIFPLDQNAMVKAVQIDSKISQGLYTKLGEDVDELKKKITSEVSRGISTGRNYKQVAQQLAAITTIGYNKAVRIARTEGNRINNQSAMDAAQKAKDKGCDVMKQWNAALDGRTRRSHAQCDGEIRELDEAFSNGLMMPSDPSGKASEVVNCRCRMFQIGKWELDEEELERLKERAAFYGLDKTSEFDDFRKKYLKAAEAEAKLEAKADQLLEKSAKENTIKLNIGNYSSAFTGRSEKKNTQTLIDYVNDLKGANEDALFLFNSFGKIDDLEANGISFKITHGKNHALSREVIQSRLPDGSYKYSLIKLNYPKFKGDNLAGQVNTALHEQMHLIDFLLNDNHISYLPNDDGFFANRQQKLVDAFNATSKDIGDEMSALFKQFKDEYKNIGTSIGQRYKDGIEELKKKYLPNGYFGEGSNWDEYDKQSKKLYKELYDFQYDYEIRNLLGGGIDKLQDIYDALSGGKYRGDGTVIYGHGTSYYSKPNSKIKETIANYACLSVTRPDLIDMLKADKPELVEALEDTLKEMRKKVESK